MRAFVVAKNIWNDVISSRAYDRRRVKTTNGLFYDALLVDDRALIKDDYAPPGQALK
jgi:hypothetical protein